MNSIRRMRPLQACFCFSFFVSTAIAQDAREKQSNDTAPLRGKWTLVSISGLGERTKTLDVQVVVDDRSFKLSGKDAGSNFLNRNFEWKIPRDRHENPYRQLQRRGVKGIDDIVDIEDQIVVFWFVGIYRLKENRLELALKYCGQGLEGKKFENFRPPSTFEGKPDDDEIRLVLKRLDK